MATLTRGGPTVDQRSDVMVAIDNALAEFKLAYPDLRTIKVGPQRDTVKNLKTALEEARKLALKAEKL